MNKPKALGSASAENGGGVYRTSISAGANKFIADEPAEFGGEATGPAPIDFLCMALASCKAITVRMYANRKGWNLQKVDVSVSFVKGDQMPSGVNTFFSEIKLTGELEEAQRKRLLEIAKVCPVDRLLSKPSEVITVLE